MTAPTSDAPKTTAAYAPAAKAPAAKDPVAEVPAGKVPTANRRTERGPKPLTYGRKGSIEIAFLWFFVAAPLVALAVAVPLAWGRYLSWADVVMFAFLFCFTGAGITVGFHRYLTHGSFKANRPLHIILTLAGTMAIEGAPIRWVADHRRHHQYSDLENDPHSPWRYGESVSGLAKGFVWAHTGWLFTRENSNARRFAPDLIADKDVRFIQRNFVWVLLLSVGLPTVWGGLATMSWQGALTGYFWGGLVRIGIVHHITWSVNSVCHIFGEQPFDSKDQARNNWLLAIPSFGESWHNLHHADPTCARHGVEPGQIDISARIIWVFEKLGWATDVRWPRQERLDAKRRKPRHLTRSAA